MKKMQEKLVLLEARTNNCHSVFFLVLALGSESCIMLLEAAAPVSCTSLYTLRPRKVLSTSLEIVTPSLFI